MTIDPELSVSATFATSTVPVLLTLKNSLYELLQTGAFLKTRIVFCGDVFPPVVRVTVLLPVLTLETVLDPELTIPVPVTIMPLEIPVMRSTVTRVLLLDQLDAILAAASKYSVVPEPPLLPPVVRVIRFEPALILVIRLVPLFTMLLIPSSVTAIPIHKPVTSFNTTVLELLLHDPLIVLLTWLPLVHDCAHGVIGPYAPVPLVNEFTPATTDQLAVEEALTNAVRHGHASKINIEMHLTESGDLACTFTDNGVGISVDSRPGLGSAIFESMTAGNWSRTARHDGPGTRLHLVIPALELPPERGGSSVG